jgi:eukaryotic-like serine/threonine-protein kinase
MGRVFKAWDSVLGRWVALKLLSKDEPALVERLAREARAQARVEHPNVCRVYDVGEFDGHPFIAMQLVDGEPLSEAGRRLTLEQKVLVVMRVAEAVHAAHRAGLVHRDLKPANVILETRGDDPLRPFVVDFGIVRDRGTETITVTGAAVGTPAFMAPEQAQGDSARIDRRTDV